MPFDSFVCEIGCGTKRVWFVLYFVFGRRDA